MRQRLELARIVLVLVLGNLDLWYWLLPRGFRGGYRSPWLEKGHQVSKP